ncbi:hypothetical protein DPEC_G00293800 [Dallia pectoralis]|uniref:Uncharacterized protein n=1 Tax=Dallia pectoralis TaxID=75939 RepID=A0ACC2FIA8_DALPE|nr:hypothetical protein DPEC_G00293800 [Dallia pectoralis]
MTSRQRYQVTTPRQENRGPLLLVLFHYLKNLNHCHCRGPLVVWVSKEATLKQARLALQSETMQVECILFSGSFLFELFCHVHMKITCYDTRPYYYYRYCCFKILILRKPNSVSKATVSYRHGLYETGQQAPVLSGTNVVHLLKSGQFAIKEVIHYKWPPWGHEHYKQLRTPGLRTPGLPP